ncbi:hypothetical protein ACJIZ3_021717 [Penstemon smallii]|uniref:Myb-like domain-containing protein n=1 Tax=Penstemon smallii TaxID=265156 RepID=A0ABD3SN69_9LAMI
MEPEMNGTNDNPAFVEGIDDKNKKPRKFRWTQQETFVLIEAKKIAEEKGVRRRKSNLGFGSDRTETKWDFVSSHCRQLGMNRSATQCRKKWGNLNNDFQKIKTWESQEQGVVESYWVMESALRKDMKLPGGFDREIYDVLDGKTFEEDDYGDGLDGLEAEDVDDDDVGDDFSPEFEQAAQEKRPGEENPPEGTIPSPISISCTFNFQLNLRQSGSKFWTISEFKEVKKRRVQSSSSNCENSDVGERLIIALERNITSLNEYLKAQQVKSQLDRELQKKLLNGLVKALAKVDEIADRLANKL